MSGTLALPSLDGAFCPLPYSPQEAVLFPDTPVQINIGVSLGALFNMKSRLKEPFDIGPALHKIKKLTQFNKPNIEPAIRIFILSRLTPETRKRVRASLCHYGLTKDVTGIAKEGFFDFYGEKAIRPYMTNEDSGIDLVLSTRPDDVVKSLENGVPAGYVDPDFIPHDQDNRDFVLGLDLDRVCFLFFGKPGRKRALIDSEAYTRAKGLDAAHARENACRMIPGHLGPLGSFAIKMFALRNAVNPDPDLSNLLIPAITAREGKSQVRAKNTFKACNIKPDGFFSVGWGPKGPVAAEQKVDIFFDDGRHHIQNVQKYSPGTLGIHVPWTNAHIDRIKNSGLPDSRKLARLIACAFG